MPHRVRPVFAVRGGHTHYQPTLDDAIDLPYLCVVVTPTINQPSTMPLIFPTELQKSKNVQCQILLLRTVRNDTCYSNTPWHHCTLPAYVRNDLAMKQTIKINPT